MIDPRILLLAALSLFLALTAPLRGQAEEEGFVSRIRREPVASSNVASIGYSRHLHALEIEFTRGAIYRFLDVPPDLYRALLAADSKGHFIAHRIRGEYRFVRIRARRSK